MRIMIATWDEPESFYLYAKHSTLAACFFSLSKAVLVKGDELMILNDKDEIIMKMQVP